MNKSILTGRLTREPEIRWTAEQMAVAKFTLAVDRKKKDAGADFIHCTAFGRLAETIERYVHKGHKIGVIGHIETGSYDKDGHKVYTTEVVVEEMEFLEKKEPAQTPPASVPDHNYQPEKQTQMPVFSPDFDDLPF